jgi:hypothetical protein
MFNSLLDAASIPHSEVRLLRHKDNRAERGKTIYELWRDNMPQFDLYQSIQGIGLESRLKAKYWASFLGTPADETLFVGLYQVENMRLLDKDVPKPNMNGVDAAGSCHFYDLTLNEHLKDLVGRLLIEWGPGDRSWIQRADNQDKQITELRKEFKEPDFPGFLNFIKPLSELERLPSGWANALSITQGVYLLTCPRTKEQYVGSATGEDGFWGRFQEYVKTGHGGNVALKSRDPSDYQVSILEVAGTAATQVDILRMEGRWKQKLQSGEMGLTRN